MSLRPALAQRRDHLRDKREVAGGERGDTDHVGAGRDGLRGHVARTFEKRAHLDHIAEIAERAGDHLGAAVVAVLAHLGEEEAGRRAHLGGKAGDVSGGRIEPRIARECLGKDAGRHDRLGPRGGRRRRAPARR